MKKIILILLLFLAIGSVTHAQDQKIGYIDSDYILSRLPEYTGLEQRLRSINEGWRE